MDKTFLFAFGICMLLMASGYHESFHISSVHAQDNPNTEYVSSNSEFSDTDHDGKYEDISLTITLKYQQLDHTSNYATISFAVIKQNEEEVHTSDWYQEVLIEPPKKNNKLQITYDLSIPIFSFYIPTHLENYDEAPAKLVFTLQSITDTTSGNETNILPASVKIGTIRYDEAEFSPRVAPIEIEYSRIDYNNDGIADAFRLNSTLNITELYPFTALFKLVLDRETNVETFETKTTPTKLGIHWFAHDFNYNDSVFDVEKNSDIYFRCLLSVYNQNFLLGTAADSSYNLIINNIPIKLGERLNQQSDFNAEKPTLPVPSLYNFAIYLATLSVLTIILRKRKIITI